ncbi:NADPH-dependent FMN reductase [Allobacillus sp. GCM10007491]|uniref:NAD(P)H-dependent oxidoreductase n=1 Tax=Allobacillus saliphilus TaxID=2912308 RepID=A0A941CV20_9BACI|nr:NADPH-dependent FMN reductase [Allobacillus saliphilus]MBR7553066.1 NAD(P)H-dependent oxidoreductase [Allobacillus saliphilus]
MKVVTLSGSIVGSKTRTAIDYTVQSLKEKYPKHTVTLVDLADYDIHFSDGRNYLDYEGDTKYVTQTIMNADAIIFGTPIFQASIPATLKNIFDLLPVDALRDKVVSMLATAGSSKHFLTPEHHLKPILGYMKAQVVQSYVFIEEKDFDQKKIINDDVYFRIDRLVEDTVILADTYQKIKEEDDKKYDF